MTSEIVASDPVHGVWSALCGEGAHEVWAGLASRAEVAELRRYSREQLRTAGIRVYRRGRPPESRVDLAAWLEECRTLAVVPAQRSMGGLQRARRTLERRELDPLVVGRLSRFTGDMSSTAWSLLRRRVESGAEEGPLLRPLRQRWRVAPSSSLVGAPVIDAPRAEIALVALLSLTSPTWQFSSTPHGAMFPTATNGWSREFDERDYVSGLSVVLDTVSGVIEKHRRRRGGRVFINERHVECADCKRVVAWLNDVTAGITAFGSCS